MNVISSFNDPLNLGICVKAVSGSVKTNNIQKASPAKDINEDATNKKIIDVSQAIDTSTKDAANISNINDTSTKNKIMPFNLGNSQNQQLTTNNASIIQQKTNWFKKALLLHRVIGKESPISLESAIQEYERCFEHINNHELFSIWSTNPMYNFEYEQMIHNFIDITIREGHLLYFDQDESVQRFLEPSFWDRNIKFLNSLYPYLNSLYVRHHQENNDFFNYPRVSKEKALQSMAIYAYKLYIILSDLPSRKMRFALIDSNLEQIDQQAHILHHVYNSCISTQKDSLNTDISFYRDVAKEMKINFDTCYHEASNQIYQQLRITRNDRDCDIHKKSNSFLCKP